MTPKIYDFLTKTVKENIMDGLGALRDDLAEFQKISEELCDENITPEKMEKLIDRQREDIFQYDASVKEPLPLQEWCLPLL